MLDELAMVICGGIISLGLCFSMGANDESMGSAYGARSLTMKQALTLGAIMQVVGSVVLGSEVTVTIQGKLFSTSDFAGEVQLLMLVFLSAAVGSTIFLLATSRFGLPVSTTHAVVGALACAAIAAKGWDILTVSEVVKIVLSWVISPVAGGVVTVIVYHTFYYAINGRKDPFEVAVLLAPIFYGLCITAVMAFVLFKGIPIPEDFPEWILVIIMLASGLITFGITKFLFTKKIKNAILQHFGENYVFYEEKPNLEMKDMEKGQVKKVDEPKEEGSFPVYVFSENEPSNEPASNEPASNEPTSHEPTSNSEYSGREDNGQQRDEGDYATSTSASESAASETDTDRSKDSKLSGSGSGSGSESESRSGSGSEEEEEEEESVPLGNEKVERVFYYLQPLTATLVTFARAVSDVSHGIGCWTAMYALYQHTERDKPIDLAKEPVPYWALALGGLSIAVGLVLLGRLVIKSVGETITKLSPSRGVAIEVGTSITVLIFSKLGIPVSSTHTLVGCIFSIGLATDVRNSISRWWAIRKAQKAGIEADPGEKKKSTLNIKKVVIIALTWIGTLPLSGCVSAILVAGFKELI